MPAKHWQRCKLTLIIQGRRVGLGGFVNLGAVFRYRFAVAWIQDLGTNRRLPSSSGSAC
jgi:hypothetical protein